MFLVQIQALYGSGLLQWGSWLCALKGGARQVKHGHESPAFPRYHKTFLFVKQKISDYYVLRCSHHLHYHQHKTFHIESLI